MCELEHPALACSARPTQMRSRTQGICGVFRFAGRLEIVEANVSQLKVAGLPALVASAALVQLALFGAGQ